MDNVHSVYSEKTCIVLCVSFYSNKFQIQLNDHVVVKGERTGCVRYIGHLENIGQPNMLFVGLELDAPGKKMVFTTKGIGFTMSMARFVFTHSSLLQSFGVSLGMSAHTRIVGSTQSER